MDAKDLNTKQFECCIVGAGPAGLGAALELVEHGVTDILIIDKNTTVGGLSRTVIFDDVRFDIGPHRFFTRNKEVLKIWHDTLGSDFKPVSRLTRICYNGKFFGYPINPLEALVKLGPAESLRAGLSYIFSQIGIKNKAVTFEEWIVQRFGRKLYETFFKVYTEKVWGIPCNQIGAEWAAQRIKGLDAFEVIKNSLLGDKSRKIKTLVEEFDYPVLGAGEMYEALCDKVLSRGAKLMLDTRISGFNRQGQTIESVDVIQSDLSKTRIEARHFFSSIPLAHFFLMLDPPDPVPVNHAAKMLGYRDHITVQLLAGKLNLFPDQWIYIHSPDIQMARVANYNNFSKAMLGGKNKSALSAEYFVFKNTDLWNEPDERLGELAVNELSSMGLLDKKDVEKTWVVRESEAYPAYYMGYQKPYTLLKSRVNEFTNFYPIGRGGLHKYNNQDHSIMSGIVAARNYLKTPGSPYPLWDINIDAEYQENAPRLTK